MAQANPTTAQDPPDHRRLLPPARRQCPDILLLEAAGPGGARDPPAPVAEASRSRPPTTAATPFLPVSIVDPDAGTHLEIELANTCVVRLRGRLSPRLLRAEITAAGERSAASIWSLRFTCRGQCKRRYSESLPEPRSGAARVRPRWRRGSRCHLMILHFGSFWSSFTPSSVAFVLFR